MFKMLSADEHLPMFFRTRKLLLVIIFLFIILNVHLQLLISEQDFHTSTFFLLFCLGTPRMKDIPILEGCLSLLYI